jgi:hypothetical protein
MVFETLVQTGTTVDLHGATPHAADGLYQLTLVSFHLIA